MDPDSHAAALPVVQRLSAILWPSFLLAGAATGVFFTYFDPLDLLHCEGEPPFSRTGAYTLGFFLFWLLAASSSFSTSYLLRPSRSAGDSRRTAT